jgi:hypothetical protein
MKEHNKQMRSLPLNTEIPIDSPLNPEFSMRTEIDSQNPFESHDAYAGDSVDEYTNLKSANEEIAEKEIGQQKENL